MGLFSLFKPAAPVLVVDVMALNESLGMKGNVAPRNQLQTLRRLSRFASREKIPVVAVVLGAPLNKAPEGKKFEGVMVHYSRSVEEHPKMLARTCRSNGSGAILVSGSASVEKLLGPSARKLRVSTFRKAFDTGGDQEQPERTSNRGNRPPRRNRQKPSQNEAPQESQPKNLSDTDAINELIDLVD